MVLIGMRDSPYVRRVAVSMKLMGVPFEHRLVSVFRHYDEFRKVNPAVKAPSFICDDGTMLMDSTLILDYVESTLPASKRLLPVEVEARKKALHLIGFALAAQEKCVQIVYEKEQRPKEKLHQPWMDRVTGQANASLAELERAVADARPWFGGDRLNAADVAVAITWRFSQYYDSVEVPASKYPALVAYSARAEALPEFAAVPLD